MKAAPIETQTPKIVVLDDDREALEYIKARVSGFGYEVIGVSNFEAFQRVLKNKRDENISIIFIDLIMPEVDGIEVMRFLAEQESQAGIILCSSANESLLEAAGRLAQAYRLRYMGHLMKPYRSEELDLLLTHSIPDTIIKKRRSTPKFTMKDIRRCIAKDELVVFFQPKIDIKTLQFVSVEALVRWQHPELGILGPGAFLPLVEKHDMIGTMTTLIMEKAYAQINMWEKQSLRPNVAVNLSARSFNDLKLPEQFIAIADKYEVPVERITLEVTESWATQDAIAALDIMTRLRLKGFNLSIDDFGTGYSTMMQLKNIPFTELKLDQSFVRGAANDNRSRAIVEACINLGQNLGLHVVAEGVERQSDWDLVTELGCDECQGYFVARPMPGDNVPMWLDRWNTSLGISRTA